MSDRWFTDDELREMARPTMDRAVEALDRGDTDAARALCEEMKHEWLMLHDLMVEGVLGLVTFIQDRLGDEGVRDAWRASNERGWKRHNAAIQRLDRKQLVHLLAATWRAHSGSGVGEHPGRFTVSEDDEKVTFTMNPCGSGQRLVRKGLYEREGYGTTNAAHPWSYDRENLPLYCTHCSFMNEIQPIEWSGIPLYPSDPPDDFHRDPCTWYWYKSPEDIPERHWRRYGLEKPA
jgi:hypothetical protein